LGLFRFYPYEGVRKLVRVEPEIDFGGDFSALADLFPKHLNSVDKEVYEYFLLFVIELLQSVLDLF
jgi:hypothetical protein